MDNIELLNSILFGDTFSYISEYFAPIDLYNLSIINKQFNDFINIDMNARLYTKTW